MSENRKNELWERWRPGESISEISRMMGKPAGWVYTILAPRAESTRRRGGAVKDI